MKKRTIFAAALLLALGLAAAGWQLWPRGGSAARSAAAAASPAAVTVTTALARREDFPLQLAATGTVSALNRVDIHPQVSGALTTVHIQEGQAVQAGQLLFTLDSRAAEVRIVQAQAQLQRDLATLADAERQLARSRDLLRQEFVSQSAVDTNLSQVEAQRAVAAADRAAIRAAQVDQSFTRITAPAAGRAGAIGVYAGSYVTPASPPLVTITQLDPIAVSFPVPQRELDSLLARLKAGDGRVSARLPDGQQLSGMLQFVDSQVDAASGTVQAKAQFANTKQQLWPGAYVNVQLALRTVKDAILIPQAAIIQGAQSRSAYVVGPDGNALLKPVELLGSAGDTAIVSGVNEGERVIVDGKQNLRSGARVVEQAAPRGPAASAPDPSASGAVPLARRAEAAR